MKFSDIFWTTAKVKASIAIQDAIVDSVVEARRQASNASNLPYIIRELIENNSHFGNFLEKQRKLIQVEKALNGLHAMNQLTDEQKKVAREELLKVKQILEL